MTPPPATGTGSVPSRLTGRLVLDGQEVADGLVAVEGDHIAWAGAASEAPERWAAAPRPLGWAEGLLLLPGLVDLHCHGGGGGDVAAGAQGAEVAARHHHRRGTTSVVGSLVSAPGPDLVAAAGALGDLARRGELAGIHLEGPFLSALRCGAQNPATLVDADPGLVDAVAEAAGEGVLAQMTWAPERAGAGRLPAALARHGAASAIGHTDATAAQTAAAVDAVVAEGARGGVALATHLFNGMPGLHHRAPGPVGALLGAAARGEAVLEVIADGVHLDGLTVRMLFDLLGPQRLALVSDAMSAAGLPDGEYVLGGLAVTLRGREVRLLEGRSLAGGVSCLLDQVRWCVTELGVPLADAVTAASVTPARALALDGVGSLAAGSFADVLVVDADLSWRAVMRRGVWLEAAQPGVPAPSEAALGAGSTGPTGSRRPTGSGGQ